MPGLQRIRVADLRPGMYLHAICGSWLDHPFWRTSFLVEDARDIARLADSGIAEVWIDAARGIEPAGGDPGALPDADVDQALDVVARDEVPAPHGALIDELGRAEALLERSKGAVVQLFQSARMGRIVDAGALRPIVADVVASVLRHPGALISLARMKDVDDTTYLHSVAVSALIVALGRQLGLERDVLIELGLGGLLHDVGKIVVPPSILTKPGRLADDEFRTMKTHPAAGEQLLQGGTGVGPIALDICLNHHEKINGSGYPNGCRGDDISLYARMGAIADVYDAISADRCYRAGWNPAEAIRKMVSMCPEHLDPRLFRAFVKAVGIYPTGSLVRLRSDHLAVVVDPSPASLLRPLVNVYYSIPTSNRLQTCLLDLAASGAGDEIVSLEDPRDWSMADLAALWRLDRAPR